ncbi:MAG: hypothetical protein RQ826_11625 [Xanthomonadales bacterium]|nr:hypothetical protein [Xanthomonadales bacterium]
MHRASHGFGTVGLQPAPGFLPEGLDVRHVLFSLAGSGFRCRFGCSNLQYVLVSCQAILSEAAGLFNRQGRRATTLAAFTQNCFDAWQAIGRGSAPNCTIFKEIHPLQEGHCKDIAERYLRLYKRVWEMVRVGVVDRGLMGPFSVFFNGIAR